MIRRLLRRPPVHLVYSRLYQVDLPGSIYDPQRGERILAFLEGAALVDRRSLHRPQPASFRSLRRIHTDSYLDELDRPAALTRVAGAEVSEETAERMIGAQRAMVGGTVLAARLALASGGTGINLGGGLHHAFADHGERFCVFNDVAVAIAELRADGFDGPVLVVDLDLHDGDGTRTIFAGDPTVHLYSVHNQTAVPATPSSTVVELEGAVGDEAYLAELRARLPELVERVRPELVIYLAGCDPAADDQIGNWRISAAGMLERDRFVLSCVRREERRLPVLIVLAGGYGLNAWRYSARFFSSLLGRRTIEPPTTEESTLRRYRQLAQSFEEHELTGEPKRSEESDWGLTAEDIMPVMGGMRRPRRLLGFYSAQGLELALERSGVLERLRSLGFHPAIELDLDTAGGDTVRIFGDTPGTAAGGRTELLVEARVRIDRHTAPGLPLLCIEWLLLQNPRARFTPERPQLPGQKHPGLGMLQDILALMVLACERLQLDGLMFVPAHYHTAAQGRKSLRFLQPAHEALLRAIEQVLRGLPLSEASRAVGEGRVIDERTGRPLVWPAAPMVYPLTDPLREQVSGDAYEARVAEALAGLSFRLAPAPAAPLERR
jgi:acetoin utilization deacetylase AcuC-like enzyme